MFAIPSESHTTREKPVVLIVEDNELSREVIQDVIEFSGFETKIAINGKEAVECVCKTAPDVIIMDIQMPIMDGLEATRTIREINCLPDVPIIALTGLAREIGREQCFAAGVDDFLTKPVDIDQLINRINFFATP